MQPLPHLRDDPRDVGRSGAHLRDSVLRIALVHVGSDHLDPRPVRWRTPALDGAAPQHLAAAHASISGDLARHSGLADARLAHEQHEPAPPPAHVLDGRAQFLDLPPATDEDAGRQALERIRLARRWLGARRRGRDCRQRLPDRRCGRRPVLGRLGEQPQDQCLQRLWHLWVVPGRCDRRVVEVLGHDRQCVVAEEGRPTSHHLVEHRAQGIEVAAGIGGPAQGLLRRHVGDRPDHHALDGEARTVERNGQTEVAELRRAVSREPHVARFQVPVDDALRVGVLEGLANLDRDA